MITQVAKHGYDLSDASVEEVKQLIEETNCKHIWANLKTLNYFFSINAYSNNWFTVVSKIKDNVIFINHWY